MEGMISDVKRMSVHDGPGIRTTLFLKGCPLRCLWCHNPENLRRSPTLSFTEKLCVGCGACADVCFNSVHRLSARTHVIDYDRCTACGACVSECYPGALKIYGRKITAEEAAAILLEDRAFYEQSRGGVTFSGGEPMMQSGFLKSVMEILKGENIHICVDTCGEADWNEFESVLPYTDLFLYDVKHIDPETHRRVTGVSNERILDNLRHLSETGAKIEVRTPVIPGINDDGGTLRSIASLMASLPGVSCWRLLPYHSMAKAKYASIGMDYPMPETDMPDNTHMRKLQASLRGIFPYVYLSSDVV